MRAIPERLRGAFTTRRYTNPRLPLPLPLLAINMNALDERVGCSPDGLHCAHINIITAPRSLQSQKEQDRY